MNKDPEKKGAEVAKNDNTEIAAKTDAEEAKRLIHASRLEKYNKLKKEKILAKREYEEVLAELREAENRLSNAEEALKTPGRRFVKLGWMLIRYGVSIGFCWMLHTEPDLRKLYRESAWLRDFWTAQCNIGEFQAIKQKQQEKADQLLQRLQQAQEDVEDYLRLFPEVIEK